MPEVDLFIVHWNQPGACLRTIKAFAVQGAPLRITVIDNDSQPELLSQLTAGLPAEVSLVRLNENHGWGGAINTVLQSWLDDRTNSYCLISAHDAVPAPDCLSMLVSALETNPRIGIACPQYPEPFIARVSRVHGVYPETLSPGLRGVVQEVSVPHGTLMLLRRECLKEIGLFDPRYFAYGDEHEIGMRATRRGWKVAMIWGAIVTNPATSTESALRSYLFARNSLFLVRDYFGRLATLVRASVILVSAIRLTGSHDKQAFSGRARLRAVLDYFAGRSGCPTL